MQSIKRRVMTKEEKAKAYDEALERARRIKNGEGDWRYSDLIEIGPVLTEIFPQLCESEDERIRKALVWHLKADGDFVSNGVTKAECIAYLEKQKENPKTKDSIPSNCVSDAKCEDRWHKVGDSLPDDPREVLCKDEAGNYFIGRYYVGEGWEISNYDDEDKPHHLNPPVSKWIDFPSEKQKEQKPPITGNDFGWIDELKHDLEHPEELDQKVDDVLKQRKGIRAMEWSDEDNIGWDEAFACVTRAEKAAKNEEELQNAVTAEKWLKEIKFKYYVHPVKQEWSEEEAKKAAEDYADEFPGMTHENDGSTIDDYDKPYNDFLAGVLWAKHHGIFQNGNTHWKPSKKQMTNLINVRNYVAHGSRYWVEVLNPLIEDLKKLM